MKKKSARGPSRERRSPCPVACSLDLLGDRWSLLIVRDLLLGRSRFKEFASAPEAIPTNILTERLERLQRGGILLTKPLAKGSPRRAYRLTAKGKALGSVLLALRDWGLRWERGTRADRAEVGDYV